MPPSLLPRHSHIDLQSYEQEKLRHFAFALCVLKSGISQICEIPLLNTLTGHVKPRGCFPLQVLCRSKCDNQD
jgi:hypothetical protein